MKNTEVPSLIKGDSSVEYRSKNTDSTSINEVRETKAEKETLRPERQLRASFPKTVTANPQFFRSSLRAMPYHSVHEIRLNIDYDRAASIILHV